MFRAAALGLGLVCSVASAQVVRRSGLSQWWIDSAGRIVAVESPDGHRAEFLIGPKPGRVDPNATESVAVARPDVLVVRWRLRSGQRLDITARGATRHDDVLLLPIGRELLGILVTRDSTAVLARGEERADVVPRLHAFEAAAPSAFDQARARAVAWLRHGVWIATSEPALDRVYRRALLQLRAQVDARGRVLDQAGTRSRPSPGGSEIEVAAALAVSGHEAEARRVLDAAARTPSVASRARWRRLAALGWLPPCPKLDVPRAGAVTRELETGWTRPVVTLADWLDSRGAGRGLAAPAGPQVCADRLAFLVEPRDCRVAASLLDFDGAFRALDRDWALAAARTRPVVLAKLLRPDGTLGWRNRVGGRRPPPAELRSSPLGTAMLAEARVRRGDRSGALRALRALARRFGDAERLPWVAASGRTVRREESAWAAARLVLALRALLLRFEDGVWRVGLPAEIDAATLDRVPVGGSWAQVRIERQFDGLRVHVTGSSLPELRLRSDAGEVSVPPGGTPRGGVCLAEPRAPAAGPLPDTLHRYVRASAAYQVAFEEALGAMRHLAGRTPRVLRVKTKLTAAAEARERGLLDALRLSCEADFEAKRRR